MAKKKQSSESHEPVEVVSDEFTRTDQDAVYGRPAEWKGIEGYVVSAVTYDEETGYPVEVLFRPRNNGNSITNVMYDDVKALLNGYR